jgi:hypothetical protein
MPACPCWPPGPPSRAGSRRWGRRLGFERVDARIAARRSYLDVLLAPVFDFPYHLTDVQGVARGWTRNGALTVTAYAG